MEARNIPTSSILATRIHGSELAASMQDSDRVMMDHWQMGGCRGAAVGGDILKVYDWIVDGREGPGRLGRRQCRSNT